MNETLSNNQDSLINQFLSLEIDKQISKSLSPGKESKSPMDGNDAKTDTEQHIDGREDSSPTKQSSASINSVNSYFENLTINSSSSTTNSSMISSGLLSSSNNNSINASSSQAYPLDYSSLNNPNDDILSFSSANSGLMSAIDSKTFFPRPRGHTNDLNLQHDIHEDSYNNNSSSSSSTGNSFNPSPMDQFGFSSSIHPVEGHHHHHYPSIDNMLTTVASDLGNPYGDPSRYLGSQVYNPPTPTSPGGGVTSPVLAPVHRSYPQHSAGGRHHHGGYNSHYPNPHHVDQYSQKQPFRRLGYQQQPLNYAPPPPPRGSHYGRGIPLQQQQRQQMNHGPYGYGGGNNDPHGHYMAHTDPYGGSPMSMPLPPQYGGHPMYPPMEQQMMYHPPPVEQSHHMHSPPYSRGGNIGSYRGADRSYSNHNHHHSAATAALVARPPISEQNLKPDEVIYQVQFKRTIRYYTWPYNIMQIQVQGGDFVIVQADRGEDLGVVTDTLTTQAFMDRRYQMKAYMDEEDQTIGCILRVANPSEKLLLAQNYHDERMILTACRDLVAHTYGLPMEVMDVEYQFDRNKITVYYDSHLRIDFRELVRDLFSSYKARIWMKKINQFHAPDLKQYASAALATGVCYVPKELTVD